MPAVRGPEEPHVALALERSGEVQRLHRQAGQVVALLVHLPRGQPDVPRQAQALRGQPHHRRCEGLPCAVRQMREVRRELREAGVAGASDGAGDSEAPELLAPLVEGVGVRVVGGAVGGGMVVHLPAPKRRIRIAEKNTAVCGRERDACWP